MKKVMRQFLSVVLAIILLMTTTGITILAEGIDAKEGEVSVLNEDSVNEDSEFTDETVEDPVESTSQSEEEQLNNEEVHTPVPEVTGIMPFDIPVVNLSATLTSEGVTVDLTGDDDTITVNNYTSTSNEQILKIFEEFDGDDITKEKKIVIRLENGLGLGSAPGMVANSAKNNWTFNADNLPDQLKSVISGAEYTSNTITEQASGTTYQPKAGTLTYYLYPATSNVSLSVGIVSDWAFAMSAGTKVHENALTIMTFEGGDQKNKAVLENYILSGSTTIRFIGNGGDYDITKTCSKDEEWASKFIVQSVPQGVNAGISGPFLSEKIELIIKVSKQIGIEGVRARQGSSITGNMLNFEIDTTKTDGFDYIKITLTQADLINATLEFYGRIPQDAEAGTYTASYSSGFLSIPYGGSGSVGSYSVGGFAKILIPKEYKKTLTVQATTNNTILSPARGAADLPPLGAFLISNEYGNIVSDQMMKVTFTDQSIGVRAVRVPTSLEGAKNIVIKTNQNKTYVIASLPCLITASSSFYTNYKFGYTHINLDTQTPDSNEYITELSYEMPGQFQVGGSYYSGTFRNSNELAFVYYGNILEYATSGFSATAVVGEMVTNGGVNEISTANQTTATTTMKLSTAIPDTSITYGASTSGINGNTLKTGNALTASVTFSKSSYQYSPSPSAVKGHYVYLRAPEGILAIDKSSIKVTWGGVTYTENSGFFTIDEITDATGSTVYRLKLDEVILGYYNANMNSYSSVTITMTVKAVAGAPKISVPLHEMFMISTIDDIKVVSGGSQSDYHRMHGFNIDERNKSGEYVGVPYFSQVLNIVPEMKLVVSTAAQLNSGGWVSYDGTGDTIINLNPEGKAEYKLTVSNYSGSDIEGFTALIPIPKYGETASSLLQDEAFQWTASILEKISLDESKYEVLYSTDYDIVKNSGNFVTWDEVNDKNEIRMVQISSKTTIPDETVIDFTFTLALTDSMMEEHAGETNIYSAYIYRDVGGSAGYIASEPVAIRLRTGVVKGRVFIDANRDGVQDVNETGRNGVTVQAYDGSTGELIAATTTKTIGGVDGCYDFLGLNKGQEVNIVFINPGTSGYRFSVLTSNPLFIVSDHTKASAESVKASTTAAGTWDYLNVDCGLIEPVAITFDAGSGIFAGTGNRTQVVKAFPGEEVATPGINPGRVGYAFQGWYNVSDGGNAVAFPRHAGTSDETFYAQYTANSYGFTVEYYYDGVKDNTATATGNAVYGSVVTTYIDKNKTGYQLNNTPSVTITAVAENNIMNVYYVKSTYGYTVEYYYDGIKDSSVTETGNAEYGSIVTTYTDKNKTGYQLDTVENGQMTIGIDADTNVMKVYYTADSFGYTIEYRVGNANGTLLDSYTDTADYGTEITAIEKTFTGYTEIVGQIRDLIITENAANNVLIILYQNNTNGGGGGGGSSAYYTITIHYLDKNSGASIVAQYYKDQILSGSAYDINDRTKIEVEGYTWDSCDTEILSGNLYKNMVVNVYYNAEDSSDESEQKKNEGDNTTTDDQNKTDSNSKVDTNARQSKETSPTSSGKSQGSKSTSTTSSTKTEENVVILGSMPRTGEDSPIGVIIIFFFGSTIGLVVLNRKGRKKRNG